MTLNIKINVKEDENWILTIPVMIIGKICKVDLSKNVRSGSMELLETITKCKRVVNETVK